MKNEIKLSTRSILFVVLFQSQWRLLSPDTTSWINDSTQTRPASACCYPLIVLLSVSVILVHGVCVLCFVEICSFDVHFEAWKKPFSTLLTIQSAFFFPSHYLEVGSCEMEDRLRLRNHLLWLKVNWVYWGKEVQSLVWGIFFLFHITIMFAIYL